MCSKNYTMMMMMKFCAKLRKQALPFGFKANPSLHFVHLEFPKHSLHPLRHAAALQQLLAINQSVYYAQSSSIKYSKHRTNIK